MYKTQFKQLLSPSDYKKNDLRHYYGDWYWHIPQIIKYAVILLSISSFAGYCYLTLEMMSYSIFNLFIMTVLICVLGATGSEANRYWWLPDSINKDAKFSHAYRAWSFDLLPKNRLMIIFILIIGSQVELITLLLGGFLFIGPVIIGFIVLDDFFIEVYKESMPLLTLIGCLAYLFLISFCYTKNNELKASLEDEVKLAEQSTRKGRKGEVERMSDLRDLASARYTKRLDIYENTLYDIRQLIQQKKLLEHTFLCIACSLLFSLLHMHY